MADLSLAFDILAKDKASPAFKSAGDSAEGFRSKLGGIAKAGKIVGTAIAGVAIPAIVGLGAAMATGIKDAVNYQTLQLKTEAVLKSTGNVANTSVKQIQTLAGSLESLSGVDEELIINSQNVLATFTKVRNEAGKGNKIFDRATKSALNMSVALGQDLQSATTMVGKALNDPIKGLTAMSKAGIQFTDQQKDQIKWLVNSGDTLSAQKIILKELETQFGGTAEAAGKGLAGDLARLKDAFQDTFREVGQAVLPTLSSLAGWLAERLPPAIATVQGFLSGLAPQFDTVKTAVGGFVTDALENLSGWWERNGESIKTWFADVGTAIGTAITVGFGALSTWWAEHGEAILTFVKNLATNLGTDLVTALTATWQVIDEYVLPMLGDFADWIGTNKPVVEGLTTAVEAGAAAWAAWKVQAGLAAIASSKLAGPLTAVAIAAGLIVGYAKQVEDRKKGIQQQAGGLLPGLGAFDPTRGIDFLKGAIPGLASGTDFWPGGWTWVGEEGRELVRLPRGSAVYDAATSAAMTAGTSTVGMSAGYRFDAVGEDLLLEQRRNNALLARIDATLRQTGGVASGRGAAAAMA